jgi:hypothetical protein
MKALFSTAVVLLAAGLFSCAPSLVVKPLKKGEKVLAVHLGGPMIRFSGLPIPVPLSGAEFHYGLSDKTTAGAGLGLTSLGFGTGQLNLGITSQLVSEENRLKTGISGVLKAHFLLDRWEKNFRFYPETGFHVFRQTGRQRWYAGASAWFETRFGGRQRTSENIWVPMLHAGWQKAEGRWQPSAEIKWIAPGEDSRNLVVDYIAPAGRGSLGVYLGLKRTF